MSWISIMNLQIPRMNSRSPGSDPKVQYIFQQLIPFISETEKSVQEVGHRFLIPYLWIILRIWIIFKPELYS